jgi:hypothetical protein
MVMKRVLAIAVSGLFMLGAMGSAWAQQAPGAGEPQKPAVEKPAPAKPAAKLKRLTGSVKSASEESLILEVTQKNKTTKEYTFTLDPKAKLSKAEKGVAAKDLQPGDAVTVSYAEADGKLIAKTVTAKAKVEKPAK